MTAELYRTATGSVLVDSARAGDLADRIVDDAWWSSMAAATPLAGGRGGVRVAQLGDRQWVLRHYRRGGMAGRVVRDRYLWTGLERTRAFREWRLLDAMLKQGLPVPVPVAARVVRGALTYRADIVTVRIAGAAPLSERLLANANGNAPWPAIGATLRRFHDAGVCHADLNAHNILLDDKGGVFVLDFDRGRLRAAGAWQRANLARLKRSLDKIGATAGRALYGPDDWRALLGSYSAE